MKRIVATALLALWSLPAQAGGLANPDLSTSGSGLANAVVAGVSDVSAAAYNPAAIAWQEGVKVMIGTGMHYRNSSVERAGGLHPNYNKDLNSKDFHALWMPHGSSLGISASLTTPYLASNDFRGLFTGVSSSDIRVRRTMVDAVYAINSNLAIAPGVDWYWSTADINRAGQSFRGSNKSGFGGHLGILWKPAPLWNVGAMLRSGARIKLSGTANSTMQLNLPDQFTLGVSHDMYDALRFEMDVDWTRWSTMKDLNVHAANGAVTQANNLNLRDSFAVMASATWWWRPDTQVRFGYAYDQGANRKSALQPIVADQPGHRLSLGAGADMFGLHLDAAYSYTFFAKQSASGAYAGIYHERRQVLSLALSKVF
jgi:long-subunit fatty acid transport protein